MLARRPAHALHHARVRKTFFKCAARAKTATISFASSVPTGRWDRYQCTEAAKQLCGRDDPRGGDDLPPAITGSERAGFGDSTCGVARGYALPFLFMHAIRPPRAQLLVYTVDCSSGGRAYGARQPIFGVLWQRLRWAVGDWRRMYQRSVSAGAWHSHGIQRETSRLRWSAHGRRKRQVMRFEHMGYYVCMEVPVAHTWDAAIERGGRMRISTCGQVPIEVGIPDEIRTVAAGEHHTLCLSGMLTFHVRCCHPTIADGGDVWSFGSNDAGQLGLGERGVEDKHAEPRMVRALKGAKIVGIAAGSSHSLALTSAGELLSWGQSDFGALGHGPGKFQ
eukprot:366229-Chlamydomonas_euryale.AAC.11